MMGRPENIRLSDETSAVVILDQTALPNQTRYLSLTELEDFTDAIKTLKVRGAPAIGICAAFGVYVLAKKLAGLKHDDFLREYTSIGSVLEASRPTAVNLSWALRRMDNVARGNPGLPVPRILELLKEEAEAIQREDAAMCRSIAEHGLSLLWDGCGVLTHCNAGPLATSLYGTALGPMILAQEQGTSIRVFADETRPLLQGARLTAYELDRAGVDVTLICDNMAGVVMGQGKVDMCFVGCDRIARNGDVANKVGTGAVAVLAKHYGIPFYVLGPTSTIDMECLTGSDIVIEERDPEEIRSLYYKEPITPVGVKCYNPAFDVTDHSLISGIITEKGICEPPYEVSLSSLFPTIDGH